MGGGGGGKKGGGGSGGADIQSTLDALGGQSRLFGGLGSYETQFLQDPYNIGNYYMDLATGGTGPQASGVQQGYGTEGTTTYGGPGSGGNIGPFGGGGGGLFDSGNPWVQGLESSLQGQVGQLPGMQQEETYLQNLAGNQAGEAAQVFNTGMSELGYASHLQNQLQRDQGLFPDQKALIEAQVNAGQNQVSQQLASEGLSGSTMGKELSSEIGLQGAATGGQLIQGNMGLLNQAYSNANQAFGVANQANQISNLANGTALSGQSQFFQELASIGQQNLTAQSTFFQQAMSGYGGAGAALQNVLAPYGYQLQDLSEIISGSLGNAQIMAGLQNTQTQAQSAGLSGLFQGLGSLLGGGGGAAGAAGGIDGLGASGITGGVSSFLGGGGAAAGGGGLLGSLGGALGGIGSGIGSGIGAIGSAIAAIFSASCSAGRGVPGVNDIRWVYFRDWILYRAPLFIRCLYISNSDWINKALVHSWIREPILFLVGAVVEHDQRTRTA